MTSDKSQIGDKKLEIDVTSVNVVKSIIERVKDISIVEIDTLSN